MPSKPLLSNITIPQHRPQNFRDFIGHEQIKKTLKILIEASQKKGDILEHLLLYGPPGIGKTSLAYIISRVINTNLHIVQGPQLITAADLINSLSLIQKGDIFFIDEIHAINNTIQDLLLTVMEDFKISVLIGKDFNSRLTNMKLPKFTLIGATTILGKINEPLEERFGICLHIDFYEINEIKSLLAKHNRSFKDHQLAESDLEFIANASKRTPRIALKLLRRVYDFRSVNEKMSIEKIFQELNIDKHGLKTLDLAYLNLFDHQPLGLNSIVQLLQVDALTITTKIEPFLLKNKWITKTTKGRMITSQGREIIGKQLI